MSQSFYFLIFFGLIGACLLAMLVWQPPKRKCPACGEDTPMQNRRCRYCQYLFGRV